MIKQKFLTALLALLTISAGAWAQTETLLTTINASSDFTSGSKTFDNKATVTFSGTVEYDSYYGWNIYVDEATPVTMTVTAVKGYTITSVKLTTYAGTLTDTEAPFVATLFGSSYYPKTTISDLASGIWGGVTKIEVYGYQNAPEGPEVTINETKTEASFDMPQNDVTVTYTLKRDMTVDVNSTIAERIRIAKMEAMGGLYAPVNSEEILPVVTDDLDEPSVTMQKDIDYELTLQKQGDGADQWTDVTSSPLYSVGTFRYKITGKGNYSGEIYTNVFQLYEGYPVEIAAHGFATYYSEDEALTLEETFAETAGLYTVSEVTPAEAVLSEKIDVMPKGTPMLIYNESDQTQQILLIPTTTDDDVFYYAGFKGTAVEKEVTAAEVAATNFYVLTDQNQFVWVKDAGTIAAHRCWLEIAPSQAAGARRIVFSGSGTTGIDAATLRDITTGDWYDLNGRKLNGMPTVKGVYIFNGKKVVMK